MNQYPKQVKLWDTQMIWAINDTGMVRIGNKIPDETANVRRELHRRKLRLADLQLTGRGRVIIH